MLAWGEACRMVWVIRANPKAITTVGLMDDVLVAWARKVAVEMVRSDWMPDVFSECGQ